jgi:hypothetical protein
MSISYHMHREYIAARAIEPEWPNDFADWAARVIGDVVLAEKLAALRVFNYRSLELLQLDVARMIAHHCEDSPLLGQQRAPEGRDFIFQVPRAIVTDCGRSARTLAEFTATLAEVESSSIYFHLFETRFGGGEGRANDFARWITESLRLSALGEKLTEFDPYMFSLEGARRAILRLCEGAAREKVTP